MTEVYAVYKDSDMIQGLGPMVLDSIWSDEAKAWDYANKQFGVMGRNPYYINHVTGHMAYGWNDKVAYPWGGDWEVRALELH